ncbi:MAG: HAD family phosphatase [Actinomycetaceae bacterium]|nr:HAD family phosphatase [Actinomycetaceae bacterium]
MKPVAALFDMDGTLTDSEKLWNLAEQAVFARLGKTITPEDSEEVTGMALFDSAALLIERYDLPLGVEELGNELNDEVVRQAKIHGMPWRPGARRLLEELRDANIPTALVTSSFIDFAAFTLENAPANTLTVAVTGDTLPNGMGKPHPEPYLRAAREFGVEITDCVAFEDSVPGVTAAHASGAQTVVIPFEVPIPDLPGLHIVSSLEKVDLRYLTSLFG